MIKLIKFQRRGGVGAWAVFAAVVLMMDSTFMTSATAQGSVDLKTCQTLETTRDVLVQKGVESDMAKGPDWGKENLDKTRLGDIKRFIEVTETLKFRCYRVFAAANRQKRRRDIAAARRAGVTIPPLPTPNPQRQRPIRGGGAQVVPLPERKPVIKSAQLHRH